MKFLEIKNKTVDSAELYFYGDIVSSSWGVWEEEDQCPNSVKSFLDEVKDKSKLDIYINSGGGNVFAGMAIYNMLKRHKAYKTVYVDGLAGSIASVIALAGDKIVIPSNAYMMIHKPWSYALGNASELKKISEDLDKIEDGIINVYMEHAKEGMPENKIREYVNNETWFSGREVGNVFNVEVSADKNFEAKSEYFSQYKTVPKALMSTGSNPNNQESKEDIKVSKNEIEKARLKLKLGVIIND